MRAAAVQFQPTRGDLVGSRERLIALTADAAVGRDLVVLPEMAASGYVFEDRAEVEAVAERADGPTAKALGTVARDHGTWIVAGFPERDGAHLHNAAMVVDPRGDVVHVYRKSLLFEADEHWATAGPAAYRTFDTGEGCFGVGICMDLNDPRFLMWLWSTPMDALAFPTNWVDEGSDVWPYWMQRMGESGAVLVAANTYGEDGPYVFSGRSAILHGGRVLASAPDAGDVVLRAAWRRVSAATPRSPAP